MADKSFGVKELNLLNASGTPTVTSPNNLNLNANTVAISTSATVGNNLTVTSTTNSANLNVSGIGTLTRAFATDLSVSGVSTITVPANANPHSSWDVVNNGASAYRFTGPGQDGAENNPDIYLVRGQRYVFKMNASGHPFQIRVANGGAAYSDGVTNNGSQTGNVVFNVQHDAPAQLYYQCTSHGSMVGNIYIIGGSQVISGIVTATKFVGDGSGLTGITGGGGSSDYVHISTTNISSATASVEITLPTGYDRFEFMFDFYSSGRAHVYMQFSENNGSSYLTNAYTVSSQNNSYASSLTWSSSTYSGVVKADRSVYSVGSIKIFRASQTSNTRFISFCSGFDGGSFNGTIQSAGGMSTAQTARINKVKFVATGSYTFDSGKIALYGIKDS